LHDDLIYDTRAINYAFRERGLAISELAYRVDVSIAAIERILNGTTDPGEMRIATLARIAEHLGIPLRSMFTEPTLADPERSSAQPDPVADAETVIALIYDRGSTPTVNTDLVTALDWDIDRLTAAYDEADRRLRPIGLRIYRQHGEGTIRPLHNHADQRAKLRKVEAAQYGLKAHHYKGIYQARNRQPVTLGETATRRLVLGALVNLGILHQADRQITVTDAVEFGHP
jgi:transcriptional regulator with XRE-family HTH domain